MQDTTTPPSHNSVFATPPRALMPDLIRAFALIGIVLVNVMGFSWPMEQGYAEALRSPLDRAADLAVNGLFMMKSYPLFSMMFGAGLAYQLVSAERREIAPGPRYFRRMAGLMGLGILHFIFFWMGDILMTYAVLGCILFLMRDLNLRTLWIIGGVLIALNTLLFFSFAGMFWLLEAYMPDEMIGIQDALSPGIDKALAAFQSGSFSSIAAYRAGQIAMIFPSVLMQQGLSALGFFCWGLAAVKMGIIDQPAAKLWRTARRFYLPIGLLGSFWGAHMMQGAETMMSARWMLGMSIIMTFAPFSALGYAGLIAKLSEGSGPVRRFLAKSGSASLTAYLLQSVVLAYVFSAYGLDLYAKLGAFQCIMIAMATAVFTLVFTGVWRSFAARGPMEVLLRRFTYWGKA